MENGTAKTEKRKMNSREKILSALKKNKPGPAPLPEEKKPLAPAEGLREIFSEVAVSIGSRVFVAENYQVAEKILAREFPEAERVVSAIKEIKIPSSKITTGTETNPHSFADVDVAILSGLLGVAENSAIWITEQQMNHRVLPFICQHLVLVIHETDLVRNMHEAYEKTGSMEAGYGSFIAGPSKTADIEQSLVLGAHGPRSLRILILTGDRNSGDKKEMP